MACVCPRAHAFVYFIFGLNRLRSQIDHARQDLRELKVAVATLRRSEVDWDEKLRQTILQFAKSRPSVDRSSVLKEQLLLVDSEVVDLQRQLSRERNDKLMVALQLRRAQEDMDIIKDESAHMIKQIEEERSSLRRQLEMHVAKYASTVCISFPPPTNSASDRVTFKIGRQCNTTVKPPRVRQVL